MARPLGADGDTDGRGVAVADLDGDGRPDVVMSNNNAPPTLYRNDLRRTGYWARVTLRGSASNRDAIGARVRLTVETGGKRKTLTRLVEAGSGYASLRSVESSKFKRSSVEAIPHAGATVVRAVLWLRGTNASGEAFECHALFRLGLRAADGAWRIHKQELVHGETVTGDRAGFTDITEAAGIAFRARHNPLWKTPEWEPTVYGIITYASAGVSAADYDNDGCHDVFFCDGQRPRLYRSNGDGTFADVSKATGALDFGYSMSAAFADLNNDGKLYMYASKVHSGQRWYGQAATMHKYLLTSVRQRTLWEDAGLYRELHGLIGSEWHTFGDRTIRGNSLLLNDGNNKYRDVAEEARANPFGWFWGSAVFDFNNDGLQDVYAASGWISGRKYDDL